MRKDTRSTKPVTVKIKTQDLKRRIYSVIVRSHLQQKQTLGAPLVYSLTSLFFLLNGYTISSENQIKSFIRESLITSSFSILMASIVLFTTGHLILQSTIFLKTSTPPRLIKLSTISSLFFTMFEVPALCLLSVENLENNFNKNQWSLTVVVFLLIFLLLCLILNTLTILTKSIIPSRHLLSPVSTYSEASYYLLFSISQITSVLKIGKESKRESTMFIACSFIESFFLLVCVGILTFQKVYWSSRFNDFHLRWCSCLLVFKITTDIIHDDYMRVGLISFFLAQSVVWKIVCQASKKMAKVDLFNGQISSSRFYFGAILMLDYVSRDDIDTLDDKEKDMHIYYTGIWRNELSKKDSIVGKSQPDSIIGDQPGDNSYWIKKKQIKEIILMFKNKKKREISHLLLVNLLEATELISYLSQSRLNYDQLRNRIGKGFLGVFELFQIQILWESRLHCLDRKSLKSEEIKVDNIFELHDNIEAAFYSGKRDAETGNLNCRSVFQNIQWSNVIVEKTQNVMKKQLEVFDFLSDTTTQISAKRLKSMNESTLKARKKVCSVISKIVKIKEKEDFATYLFPLIIFFYAGIQYNIEEAVSYVMIFKKKLRLLIGRSFNKRLKSETGVHQELDSITLQILIEKDKVGKVANASLNYRDFLGDDPNETGILGKSVNILLPNDFAQNHLNEMASISNMKVLNNNRFFIIQDLEHNLKRVNAIIKIAPSITEPISAYSLLSFNSSNTSPSLILDEKLNIISADYTMNTSFVKLGLKEPFIHISKSSIASMEILSQKMHTQISLLQKMNHYFKSIQRLQDEGSTSISEDFKLNIFKMLGKVVEKNSKNGMVFDVGHGSFLHDVIGHEKVKARFDFTIILGVKVVLVHFDGRISDFVNRESGRNTAWSVEKKKRLTRIGKQSNIQLNMVEEESDDCVSSGDSKRAIGDMEKVIHSEVKIDPIHQIKQIPSKIGLRVEMERNRENEDTGNTFARSGNNIQERETFEELIQPASDLMRLASRVPMKSSNSLKNEPLKSRTLNNDLKKDDLVHDKPEKGDWKEVDLVGYNEEEIREIVEIASLIDKLKESNNPDVSILSPNLQHLGNKKDSYLVLPGATQFQNGVNINTEEKAKIVEEKSKKKVSVIKKKMNLSKPIAESEISPNSLLGSIKWVFEHVEIIYISSYMNIQKIMSVFTVNHRLS